VSEDGRQLNQDEIVGLELSVGDEAGSKADFRIEGSRVDPSDPEIRLYDISVKDTRSGRWRRFCQPGPDGIAMAFPLRGMWTPSGRHEDKPTFILTCTAGAIGKCVRFGYKPWKTTLEGVSLWAYHEACTRMVRADYWVLSALVPASIAGSMKDAIFQAASNTLKTVAVRRRKWNLR
jgi:ADYC domain